MSEIGRTPPAVYVPTTPPALPASPIGPGGGQIEEVEPESQESLGMPAVAYEGAGHIVANPDHCVIGIDGGGTKVNAAVADMDGVALGGGTAGPCNIAATTAREAFSAARAACVAALATAGRGPSDVRAVCAGVAGVSYRDRKIEFQELLQQYFPNAAVAVEPDYAIALTGGTGGAPGIVVIAGTGSVAYGENGRGAFHKAGAYGYLIDDDGSGYGVGRSALAAVLKAADKTGQETLLTERVLQSLDLASTADIVPGVYGGALSRVRIASLATVVSQTAADSDDDVAKTILLHAGGALGQLTATVAQQLFSHAVEPFPIVMTGSLWKGGGVLLDTYTRSVRRFAPAAVLVPARESPLHGAIRRALRLEPTA